MLKSVFKYELLLEYPKLLRVILNLWQKVRQNKDGFNLMFFGTASADSISDLDFSVNKRTFFFYFLFIIVFSLNVASSGHFETGIQSRERFESGYHVLSHRLRFRFSQQSPSAHQQRISGKNE